MRLTQSLALLLLVLTACDGAKLKQELRMHDFAVTDGDFYDIAKDTFARIDPHGAITTIVVPSDADPRVRKVLKTIARVVAPSAVPQSANESLPAGYFALQSFTIDDGVAMIEGQLGPVMRSVTAAGLPDCGKLYSVMYAIEGGDWVSHSYKVTRCDQTRHWVPIDEADKPSQTH